MFLQFSAFKFLLATPIIIVVDGYGGACGDYNISVTAAVPPPANDDCAAAQGVTGPYPQNVAGTTIGATVDCAGWLDWDAVWYAIDLPNVCNSVKIDLCGAICTSNKYRNYINN